MEALGDRVSTHFTINEINTPQQMTGSGLLSPEAEAYPPKARALYANSRMVDAVHAANTSTEAGVTISLQQHVAEPRGEALAAAANEKLNQLAAYRRFGRRFRGRPGLHAPSLQRERPHP